MSVVAACVTVKGIPAMVIVPVRWLVEVLAATEKLTTPLPLPLAPLVMVRKLALLVAVHAQPLVAVTLMLPVLALALKLWLVKGIE